MKSGWLASGSLGNRRGNRHEIVFPQVNPTQPWLPTRFLGLWPSSVFQGASVRGESHTNPNRFSSVKCGGKSTFRATKVSESETCA
jgi:hypothetical protein